MDPVTQLKLDTFLHLLLYPVLALSTVAAAGLAARRGAEGQTRPGVTALALGVALTISWVGIVAVPALPPVDTRDYTPFFALLLPLPFLALESRPRLAFVAPLAGLSVVLMLWLYLKPIMGGEYAPADRVAQVGALMLLVWLGVDRLAVIVPAPATLSALCFAAIGAAVAALVSGTAIIGQALGGIAAVTGVASIIVWRLPRLAMGRAAVAAALVPFFGSLVFAHFYGDLPAVPAAIAALSPSAWPRRCRCAASWSPPSWPASLPSSRPGAPRSTPSTCRTRNTPPRRPPTTAACPCRTGARSSSRRRRPRRAARRATAALAPA